MKSYKKYLTESDYLRFLKKNKHLSDDQKNKINIFFKSDKKAVQQFEKKWGWQSKYPQKMMWDDFEDIMMLYKSGRRKNLKSINIRGKKGEDYWPVKLKTKGFIANIPLNYNTANFMNSCRYGELNVNYCIGWGDGKSYWLEHVITDNNVPVYIIDGDRKWVVMIDEDNHSYQVWDKLNQKDIAIGNKEPIPGFSIKKELLNSRMKKVYDEIREDFYAKDGPPYTEANLEEAMDEYGALNDDIKNDIINISESEREYNDNGYDVKNATIEYYTEEIEDLDEGDPLIDIYKIFINIIDDTPPDKEELLATEKEYQKEYPDANLTLQGELYDYYSQTKKFVDIKDDYPLLIRVLKSQNNGNIIYKKVNMNIINFINENAFENSYDALNWRTLEDDMSDMLDNNNIFDPDYNDEYYD